MLKLFKQEIPALDSTNFVRWRDAWLRYQTFYDLPKDIFSMSATRWTDRQREDSHEQRSRVCVYFAIVGQLEGGPLAHLVEDVASGDAQQLWRNVYAEFRDGSISNITDLEQEFFNLNMSSSRLALKPYGRAVKDKAKVLNEISPDSVGEKQKITQYLRGLHSDFTQFRAIVLEGDLSTMTLAGVVKRVENYAKNAKLQHDTTPQADNADIVQKGTDNKPPVCLNCIRGQCK